MHQQVHEFLIKITHLVMQSQEEEEEEEEEGYLMLCKISHTNSSIVKNCHLLLRVLARLIISVVRTTVINRKVTRHYLY